MSDDNIHNQLMMMITKQTKEEISGGDACVPNRVRCQARDQDLDPTSSPDSPSRCRWLQVPPEWLQNEGRPPAGQPLNPQKPHKGEPSQILSSFNQPYAHSGIKVLDKACCGHNILVDRQQWSDSLKPWSCHQLRVDGQQA